MNTPTIIFEDGSLLAISKPAGMTVNKADTVKEEVTVQDWVQTVVARSPQATEAISSEQKLLPNGDYNPVFEFNSRGGIVHRLDKETSGILLIAKNPEVFAKLKSQFMGREVQKTYLALAHGKISPEEGEIDAPVGRLPYNRIHFGVWAGGREAQTRYKVIANYKIKSLPRFARNGEVLSLVELHPKTGRTHQIRVHLKHINHPIVSDPLYAGRKMGRDDRKILSRLFLHAAKLSFVHPVTGKEMTLEAQLPQELSEFMNKYLEKLQL